ncbi:MAG: energy-coupling factor transporter transmembrane protein EcfT [Clostridia bacterium]|nr:energy-coupling factor transporter transmembrane protein EcfT [Clostridia bacterium]
MLKDITIGQFFPGDSLLHRLDPRMKIVLTVLYIVLLFVAKSIVSFAAVTVFSLILVFLSKISPKLILKSLKPLLFIIVFTTVLNIFYVKGTPIFEPIDILGWQFTITYEGLLTAVVMVLRITLLITTTSLLTYTTSPIALTDGIERLLSPLNAVKVPVHEFSMMMTIALRFIPTLIEETEKIMAAQKSRGSTFSEGGLIKRAKALIPILVPLFVSAFRRAEELATAMECRCYAGGKGRTRLKQYKLCARDYISLLTVIAVFAATIAINILLQGIVFAI